VVLHVRDLPGLGYPCSKSSRLPLEATTTKRYRWQVKRQRDILARESSLLPDGGAARPVRASAFPARFQLLARADEGNWVRDYLPATARFGPR
jgi:hypothetical protein